MSLMMVSNAVFWAWTRRVWVSCSERMAAISFSRESIDLSSGSIISRVLVFVVGSLLLQLVPGWQLVDLLGDEVVFNHLTA